MIFDVRTINEPQGHKWNYVIFSQLRIPDVVFIGDYNDNII